VEPKLFQIGSEFHVELIDSKGTGQGTEYTCEAGESALETIEEAVDSCPTRAIKVTRV